MKVLVCTAATLLMLATWPAAAQYQSETPSDRYTRDPAQARERNDQQAQTPDRRQSGEVETLRGSHMSSPNMEGQRVPEDPSTGVPEADQRNRGKQSESVPRP